MTQNMDIIGLNLRGTKFQTYSSTLNKEFYFLIIKLNITCFFIYNDLFQCTLIHKRIFCSSLQCTLVPKCIFFLGCSKVHYFIYCSCTHWLRSIFLVKVHTGLEVYLLIKCTLAHYISC